MVLQDWPKGSSWHIWVKQSECQGLECQLINAGMVHQARKDQGKRNITVFGVASDGEAFRYYRIDNESHVRNQVVV